MAFLYGLMMKLTLNLEEALKNAMHAASAAGEKIMVIYNSGNLGMQTKEDDELFGIADTTSNELILRALHKQYPEHGLLAEEKISAEDMDKFPASLIDAILHCKEREYCWVIDPLDGTVDFKNKTGMFGVHIGLNHGGVPIIGVNHYPVTGKSYIAIKGNGAYSTIGDKFVQITVSDLKDISKLNFAKSTAFPDPVIERFIADNGMPTGIDVGSMGLKICKVADGAADIYLNANKAFGPWDPCSGEVIVTEAGGMITDLDGNRFDYRQDSNKYKKGVLVTNGKMHDELLSKIREYLPVKA